jgi:hypothetical protein
MDRTAPALMHHLDANRILRLAAPLELQARAGTLWVTIDGDPEDIVLEPGDRRRFDAPAALLVYALGGRAALQVRPLAPAPRSPSLARLARWIGGALAAPALGARS